MAEAMRHRANLYQALECYDRILAARPQNPVIAGERCYLLQHLSHFDGQAILREHRAWNDRFAKPLQSEIRPHENDRDPDRRLRSGYVSPDFKNHCQKFFTIPLFSNHDHKAFEIYCYSSVDEPDDVTHKIRQYADLWRTVAGETDEKLAEIIRRDRVDILVDLTMHMPHGRPLLFAQAGAGSDCLARVSWNDRVGRDELPVDRSLSGSTGGRGRQLFREINSVAQYVLVLRPWPGRSGSASTAGFAEWVCYVWVSE